jgi:hypothetical protein
MQIHFTEATNQPAQDHKTGNGTLIYINNKSNCQSK